jgi:hypothetical protein
MDQFIGSSGTVNGGLSKQQMIALTILIAIAIAGFIIWIMNRRRAKKEILVAGPFNLGKEGPNVDPDQKWVAITEPDQTAALTSDNITCSFFVYVDSESLNKVPISFSENDPRMQYLVKIGTTMGIIINPINQTCRVDIMQARPTDKRTGNIVHEDIDATTSTTAFVQKTVSAPKVLVGKWNQITVCVEGRSIDIYVNGRLANSAIMDNIPYARFSGMVMNASPDFEGQACLFQMWPYKRTSAEILGSYEKNTDIRGKPLVPDPSLTWKGAWKHLKHTVCKNTSLCGFDYEATPLEFVEYEFH